MLSTCREVKRYLVLGRVGTPQGYEVQVGTRGSRDPIEDPGAPLRCSWNWEVREFLLKGWRCGGRGLGSKSWWHSPNSSSSLAFAPSRTPHALLAQVRMQSPSSTPAGCPHSPLLLTPSPPPLKLPWVKPPQPAHCHLSQRRTWVTFSLHSPTPAKSTWSPTAQHTTGPEQALLCPVQQP